MINETYILTLYGKGARAVLRYIQQLDQRIEDAEMRVERSQHSIVEQLAKELARAKATIARKAQQLLEECQLNHQLKRRIRELEREIERGGTSLELDSHNSSLPPSLDPPWKKAKRTTSLKKKTGLKPGGQPGHRGATLRQVAQADHLIIHTPDVCTGCGEPLHKSEPIKYDRRQVFDILKGQMKVTEHRAETLKCAACLMTTKARFPGAVRAPAQYGEGVLTRAVYLHLYQPIPVARTSETMRDLFACPISAATIERASRLSSGKLVKTEHRIKALVRDSPVIGVDETGLRVAGSNAYVHVARTEQLMHYAYDERRGRGAMDEIGILPQFKGMLVRDGWASYKWYEQCRHSLCNAHLLRELVFIEEVDPTQTVWTSALSKLLVQIKDAASEARAMGELQLSQKQQESWLERYQQLIKKAERLNPPPSDQVEGDPAGKKPVKPPSPRNIINRLQRRRDEVLRFMTDLTVPFDNNGSERDLRMIKLQQKISGCFRTEDGARRFCRLRSYLSTARTQAQLFPALCSGARAERQAAHLRAGGGNMLNLFRHLNRYLDGTGPVKKA